MEAPGHPSERNQRAKIRMSSRELSSMLDLPAGMRVVHSYVEHDPMSLVFTVEGEALNPQPHDVELPILGGEFTRQSRIQKDGQVYHRWGWQR